MANVLAEAPVQKLLMVATERLKVTPLERTTMCPSMSERCLGSTLSCQARSSAVLAFLSQFSCICHV